MSDAPAIIFWVCSFIMLYAYAGYPALVFILSILKESLSKKRVSTRGRSLPAVSLIIAAYNEEAIIRKKIENSLSLSYPPGLLEIIVVTDGSTDNTPLVAGGFDGIKLMHQPLRKGKLAATQRAIAQTVAPILIFSDANTLLNAEAINRIGAHFDDPAVGGVAGEKKIAVADAGAVGTGEGLYWRYESWLKKNDSRLKTTVGAAGELFSIRRSLYTVLPEQTVIEDFVQSMKVCEQGFVVRYEPGAYASEAASLTLEDEMERKTRISAGAFQAMGMLGRLFNPFRFPVVSFLFVSHRILRWTLCPLALPLIFASSIWLASYRPEWGYQVALYGQIAVYLVALLGWMLARRNHRVPIAYPIFYFLFMHFCVYAGGVRFLRRKQSVLWASAKRKS